MPIMCSQCMKTYSCQSNLNRHLKENHQLESEVIAYDKSIKTFKCLEGCHISFTLNVDLILHLKNLHNINVEKEERVFASMEEFRRWFIEFQNLNDVEYIKPRGNALLSNEDSVIYYNCNRSGKTRDVSKTNERIKKTQGSKKLNFSCTSQIKVVLNKINPTLTMTFFKTHYGHDFEIRHLRLPTEEKIKVAQKLTMGVNVTKILDNNRENFNETKLKRMDLLTRKDISNIKSSFNIQLQEGVRHAEDAISVDLYVQECRQSESNPILFYKPQNIMDDSNILKSEDFCLIIMNSSQKSMLMKFGNSIICIDSTHGMNSYDFELSTLLVVDDWGEGFPGACMLTNRKDSVIFDFFYQKLKSEVGILKPKTFMTDITNVFYNPWRNVMGEVPSQLYCAWHIDRAWQSNLNKITNQEKRNIVYKTLKLLQTLINQEDFQKIMTNFVIELFQDPETYNFGQYFKSHYQQTYQKWAYCYRQNSGINTNMRLESMHKIIKHMYLDGKKVKRLDKGLHALNKYIRDKIVDRILKKIKGKNSWHIQNIHNRHKSAKSGNLEIVNSDNDNNHWTIGTQASSSSQNNLNYKVEKTSNNVPCCNLVCALCQICVHSYTCSCPDFFIHNTICKHIHYLVLQKNLSTKTSVEPCLNIVTQLNSNNHEEISQHLKTLSQDNNNTQTNENLLKNISTEMLKLQDNVKYVKDTEILKHVLKTLKTENILVQSNFNEVKKFNIETNKEPANKNIDKQLTFHSTKKRKTIHKHLNKPNFEEVEELKNCFLNQNLDISKTPQNDHTYL